MNGLIKSWNWFEGWKYPNNSGSPSTFNDFLKVIEKSPLEDLVDPRKALLALLQQPEFWPLIDGDPAPTAPVVQVLQLAQQSI